MDPRWQDSEWGGQEAQGKDSPREAVGQWGAFGGEHEWQNGVPPPAFLNQAARRPAFTFPPGGELGWKHSMSPSNPFLRSPSAVSSPSELKEMGPMPANNWMLVRDTAPQAQLAGNADANVWGCFPASGGAWPSAVPAPQLWNAVADRPEREQGRALRQQVGAMAMDAAARALTAQAHNGGMQSLQGGHNAEPEAPYRIWDSRAPFHKGQGFHRVQSASVLPQRGAASWEYPDTSRGFSNPDTRPQPLSGENVDWSAEGLRASQDFSGSVDARKGSISDSPTPEVQASGSVPLSTGGQSTPNYSAHSERFKSLPPTSSGEQRFVGHSVMRAPPAVTSDMHAPKEPVWTASQNKRVRTAEDSGTAPPSKKGRGTPSGSQEEPIETTPVQYRNSRVEATPQADAHSDGVRNVNTFTGSSGLADNSGEDSRVNAIMAELGNMSRDYVSVLASSGLSEIGPSNKLPEAGSGNSLLPVTSSMAATSTRVRPESLPGPSPAPASARQSQSYLPPSAWVRRLQPTGVAPPRPTFAPPLVLPPAARPNTLAVRGNVLPARPIGPSAVSERGAPRPRHQGPDRNAEVPSMSFSGLSGWERAQNARSFGHVGRSFGQDHSFAGQAMQYLSGRAPSVDTSLASFAVPIYRGSDAGVSLSNIQGSPLMQGGQFPRPHMAPSNSPSRETLTRAALMSSEGRADIPGHQAPLAAHHLRGFRLPERPQGPEHAGFPEYNYQAWPQAQEHLGLPNPALTPVRQLANAEAPTGERPSVLVPRPNLEPASLPQTPAGEDVERNPVLDSSGEGAPPVSNPSSESQDPNLLVRIDEVPNVQTESPPEAQNNEGSFGTKSSSPSAGVVPQQPQASGEADQPAQELPREEQVSTGVTSAQLLAASKPSKPVIQSMPHIELPEAVPAPPERQPSPLKAKGKVGNNREVALEQAVRNEEGSKGMGKRTASKGSWMDRLLQQATGTAIRKKDAPEELKGKVRRRSSKEKLDEMDIDPPEMPKAVDPPQLSGGLSDLARSSSNPNIQHFPATRKGGKSPLASLGLQAPWSNLDLAQALGVTSRGVELSRGNQPLKAGQSGMKVTGAGKDGSGNRTGSQSSADFAAAMANVRAWRKETARYRAGQIAESPILRETMALGETRKLTCLFCGQTGHTVAECSETPVSELSKLETLAARWSAESANEQIERCLLCQRKGHWGVDCSPTLREEGEKGHVLQSPESGEKRAQRKSLRHQEDAEGRLFGVNVHLERSKKSKSTRNSGSGKESLSRREGNASGAGYEGSKERSKRSSHSAYRTSSGAKAGEAATGLEAMHIRAPGKRMEVGGQKELGTVPPMELTAAVEGARLPRRDLVRWSETEDFERQVEGFLVRVRFGRRAQEQNGSGYRIGRITRAASTAEQGQTVMTLTVDLGDGECIIDGQYVSNKQFTKAELEHWCQVSGGRNGTAVTIQSLQRKAAEKASWPQLE